MPEAVDGDDGAVRRSLLDVQQGVSELVAVGMEEVDRAWTGMVA